MGRASDTSGIGQGRAKQDKSGGHQDLYVCNYSLRNMGQQGTTIGCLFVTVWSAIQRKRTHGHCKPLSNPSAHGNSQPTRRFGVGCASR